MPDAPAPASNDRPTPLRLSEILGPELVLLDLAADDVEDASRFLLVRVLREREGLGAAEAQARAREVLAAGKVTTTVVEQGVACPHGYLENLERSVVVMARLEQPLLLDSPDGLPTDLVFLLAGPQADARGHLSTLQQLARLLQDDIFLRDLREAEAPSDVVEAVHAAERRQERPDPPPKASLARAGLEARTGRFAGGLVDDLRRKLPHYLDDLRQGLYPKCLAATIFLFFACFTAALTFGGIMSASTGGAIGVGEMIMATALCGVTYALLSGQPLTILGGTGPLLIFTTILYDLCQRMELPFLTCYAWVGLWGAAFILLLALSDASVLVRYLTRFTDEIFVLLIALIFVHEAVLALVAQFRTPGVPYSSALSSLVLALGTLGIAWSLRQIRETSVLRSWARNFLADFGTVIAIGTMTVLASYMRDSTSLPHIEVPASAGELDLAGRVVSLSGLSPGVILALAAPGLLLAVLVFFDQQITGRVVNSPEFHLRKGPGYHLDLAVVGVLIGICSMLGLPWLVAATVRSLNHVKALSTTHAEDRPGGTRVLVDGVLENRLTGMGIHLLVGGSLLILPLLELVPMAALYGIFLYMGLVSFSGNQFAQRVTLWVRDPSLYPRSHYIRRVPRMTIHAYTAIQVGGLALLWAIKSSSLALVFPLVLGLLAPFRAALNLVFSPRHLAILDAEETPADEHDREAE